MISEDVSDGKKYVSNFWLVKSGTKIEKEILFLVCFKLWIFY